MVGFELCRIEPRAFHREGAARASDGLHVKAFNSFLCGKQLASMVSAEKRHQEMPSYAGGHPGKSCVSLPCSSVR